MDANKLSQLMPPGFYPFWFWNARLDADEIRWQIRQMAEQGVKGFYIHSRQGLDQPYLSQSFFEMVDAAVEEAQAHGMTVQLYDEYPYPSGVAGGEVVLGSPEYHATELRQRTYDVEGGSFRLELMRGKVLAVRAYPLKGSEVDWSRCLDLRDSVGMSLVADSYVETGLTTYNQKRFFSSRPTPILEAHLPAGKWRIFTSVQIEVERNKYWGSFVDVFNPEAVQAFLRLTHERYFRRYGDKFGKVILSIFTDETYPYWSARLPGAFQAAYGYDLLEHLEALQDPTYPKRETVLGDMRRLVYEMFVDAYDRQIAEWCQAHGIAYCGEKPSVRLAQLRYMDIPGCEPGHTKVGAPLDMIRPNPRQNCRATASAAYFYGKVGALDECYHSLGWSGTLQDAKFMADAQLLFGIKYLVPHGFFYSTHGLAKHDAPPTFFFQMPYWHLFGHLSQHIERIYEAFDGTYIDANILIVDPTYGVPVHEDQLAYVRLQTLLLSNRYEYMQVDTDILQESRVENGTIYARDIQAKVVIVPPMQVMEKELDEWLRNFEHNGGKVIRCAQDFSDDELLSELAECVQPAINLWVDGGQAEAVWCVRRKSADKLVWLVLNTGKETLDLQIGSQESLQEIPLDAGKSPELVKVDNGYRRTVAPFASFLLETLQETGAAQFSQPLPHITARLDSAAQVKPLHANVLRMAQWQMSLLNAGGSPSTVSSVPAVPLANQLAISKLPFTPELDQWFGLEPRFRLPEIKVRYEYAFENAYSGPVELVMEPGSIVGEWQVWINEAGPITADQFAPTTAHVRGSLGLDVTGHLRPGQNLIRVEVKTDQLDGGLLNPLYLAGDFGVSLNPVSLVERAQEGGFETYTENGLPYYAGGIEYTLSFALAELPEAERVVVDIETPLPFYEAMEISINGSDFQPALWNPRSVELPTNKLRIGQNQAVARVFTTLIRSFEGQRFDDQAHAYKSVA